MRPGRSVQRSPRGSCSTSLVKRAGFKLSRADTGAVTLIQRFGSAANLNIHLHWLVLDGVYLNRDGVAVFHEATAPTVEELEALLAKIITRTMRTLTRLGVLIEEPEGSYLAETDTNGAPCGRCRPPRALIVLRWAHALGRKC